MLKYVGQSKVPHRQREKIFVSRLELFSYVYDSVPSLRLSGGMGLSLQYRVLGFDGGAIEPWKAGCPKIYCLNGVVRAAFLIRGQECPCDLR